MNKSNLSPITEDEFMKVAEVAAESQCLRKKSGEHGDDWGIMLNGHLMMCATVNEDGEREYFSCM